MNIVLATGMYPPEIGGPATYSKLLHDELPKRGVGVSVANFSDYLKQVKGVRHLSYTRELLRRLRGADLLYAQDPVSVGLPAVLASAIRHNPLFLKIVGDYAWEQGVQRFGVQDSLEDFSKRRRGYPWQVQALKAIECFVARRALRIITPSRYLKTIVTNWGISEDKVTVIYNGVHAEFPAASRAALRVRYNISGTVLLSAGRLVPWKGFEGIIKLLPILKEKISDPLLIIAGDGPDRGRLTRFANECGVGDRVRFTGTLERRVLFEYICATDLFVLNTAYEGFSHQLLEVMALGTPVVTTWVGGNPEIIKDGETGILVAQGDQNALAGAIVSLARDASLRGSLARKAREAASQFTDARMLRETVELFEGVLKGTHQR